MAVGEARNRVVEAVKEYSKGADDPCKENPHTAHPFAAGSLAWKSEFLSGSGHRISPNVAGSKP